MPVSFRRLAAATLATSLSVAGAASAAPIGQPLMAGQAVSGAAQQVRWGRGWGGWGWGGPFVAGAIVGGALAAPYYYGGPYGYGPRYYSEPVYDEPDDSEAYCRQHYKSYDPRSGTYLGTDKRRHPCP
jgi:BA14K-like protein